MGDDLADSTVPRSMFYSTSFSEISILCNDIFGFQSIWKWSSREGTRNRSFIIPLTYIVIIILLFMSLRSETWIKSHFGYPRCRNQYLAQAADGRWAPASSEVGLLCFVGDPTLTEPPWAWESQSHPLKKSQIDCGDLSSWKLLRNASFSEVSFVNYTFPILVSKAVNNYIYP